MKTEHLHMPAIEMQKYLRRINAVLIRAVPRTHEGGLVSHVVHYVDAPSRK